PPCPPLLPYTTLFRSGPRIALVPATGEAALADGDLDDGRILAEHAGTIVHTEGKDLVAAAAEDAAELWRTALPDGIDARCARARDRKSTRLNSSHVSI